MLEYWGRIQGHHPVYLPDKSIYAEKIVEEAHLATLHGGVSHDEFARSVPDTATEETDEVSCESLVPLQTFPCCSPSSRRQNRCDNPLSGDWF